MGDRQGEESPKAIIFTGIQASGKSTFFKQHFRSGFVHINLDTLHTRNKEAAILEQCLQNRASFVVDNTNPTADDRQRYIKAAREHGYRIEGYFFPVHCEGLCGAQFTPFWKGVYSRKGNCLYLKPPGTSFL